jgi:uncharacterized membrane protein YvlD (DUF360 family)
MISRLVLAVVVAVVVGLVCILLGTILVTLKVPIAVTIGDFLAAWGWVIGVLAGLWFFFTGGTLPGRA